MTEPPTADPPAQCTAPAPSVRHGSPSGPGKTGIGWAGFGWWTLVSGMALLVGLTGFVRQHFGPVTLDQVSFHLSHGGVEWTDPKILARGLRWGLGALALSGLVVWVVRRRSPRLRGWILTALLSATGWSLWATVASPCKADMKPDPLLGYVDPARQRFHQAGQAPDLLIVFVESLEEAYADTSAFDEVLVPSLARMRAQHQDLGELRQIAGASWTMAGMFATLCGLPLQSVGLNTAKSTEFASRFFGGGRCLTDVLQAQGWDTAFYGAASLDFAGKGRFLADHGVRHRFGRQEWQSAGLVAPSTGWGLRDSTMLSAAWQHMSRPGLRERPRAHIVLTVDTHGPQGVVDAACRPDLAAQADPDPAEVMRAALHCSDRSVADLVERFAGQATGRPKVALVVGDHLSTPQPLSGPLEAMAAHKPRNVFHLLARWDAHGRRITSPATAPPRVFTHLDIMPTLAEALGLRWQPQTHRLGLGVSLLSNEPVPTQAERWGPQALDAQLSCPSPVFRTLWTRNKPQADLTQDSR